MTTSLSFACYYCIASSPRALTLAFLAIYHLTLGQAMADTAATMMSKMTLSSTPSLVAKREPGKAGRAVDILSNITPITLKKNVAYFKYDLRMYAIFSKKDGSEGTREFSKQTRDDYNEQERKKACTEIFLHLSKNQPIFRGDLIYDRAAILFSTLKLDGVTGTDQKFSLSPAVQSVCPDAIRVDVTIKQAADTFQVTSNDLNSCVNADFKNESKGLMEVLNLATSQIPFFSPKDYIVYGNGNIYLLEPNKFGFQDNEAPSIGKDKYTGIGLSKGVKILEGNNKPGGKDYMPALVLDVKKTAFHFDNHLLTSKIEALYGPNQFPPLAVLNRDLKDIRCLTTHKKASIVIGSFTNGPVGKATFTDRDGKQTSVVSYYETRYNVKITRPDLPGVIDKHQRNIYPTDILKVAPNQRVKASQQTKETVETLIKVSAIKPEIRFKQTQRLAQLLQLHSKAAEATGVTVPANQPPLAVPARQLGPVGLLGGQGSMAGPSWRGSNRFVVGAKVEKWAAFLFFNGGGRPRFNPHQVFQGFVPKLMEAGNRKGMFIPPPAISDAIEVKGHVDGLVSEAVKKAASAGCTFVLIVSDDRIKSHDQLKYEELVYKITTQEVTLAKAAQVAFEGKVQTMENIIMKTNVKLRGMNHVLAGDNGLHHSSDAIIMGIFVQQPRGMSAKEIEGGAMPSMPAVIGLSANNGNLQAAPPQQRELASQQYFTTAYKFANPREWMTGETQRQTLKKMVIDALKQFKENRGKIPNKVIVYRGGVSEGMLPYIASVERDAFHAAFTELNASYKPALVIIACSKEHNERFYHKVFPTAAPGARVDTNLPPGLIVDRVAVNPELNEFYLQSHKALQGTAKATKYTLLHESSGRLTNDAIQHMTNALCHLHEVVNSTTAIPTPLYVAEESAKRAVNIYHHVKGIAENYNLDEINRTLSPSGLGSRINA
ncbi:hypothetical protein PRIPAC_75906 [Pristionchus pacificus]|uniref:Uncharacterized protein n=1 Tax=Pristionchus pacificus TaxID=54126 RepID=A0A2A6B5E8_PRIPA|nr:hypothetical protein PRIPAC_75906 [Pristionchus pacificus]|eukprot:PDM61102.1 hypothetical protein PRIPAC_54908 [Pristionchus pacificus]